MTPECFLCQQMANQFSTDAVLEGSDSELAFLNNASLSYPLLGFCVVCRVCSCAPCSPFVGVCARARVLVC